MNVVVRKLGVLSCNEVDFMEYEVKMKWACIHTLKNYCAYAIFGLYCLFLFISLGVVTHDELN